MSLEPVGLGFFTGLDRLFTEIVDKDVGGSVRNPEKSPRTFILIEKIDLWLF